MCRPRAQQPQRTALFRCPCSRLLVTSTGPGLVRSGRQTQDPWSGDSRTFLQIRESSDSLMQITHQLSAHRKEHRRESGIDPLDLLPPCSPDPAQKAKCTLAGLTQGSWAFHLARV